MTPPETDWLQYELPRLFSLEGRAAVVTGATGAIGSELSRVLAVAGARVALIARRAERVQALAGELGARGCEAIGVPADVLDEASLRAARNAILERFGQVDILLNGAGGNSPAATVPEGSSMFGLSYDAVREVIDLNLLGTLLPTLVFGPDLVAPEPTPACSSASIVNISSMAAGRAMTRVVGYSAAKAGVENLTRWLAVQLAGEGRRPARVNAIAPGFLLGEQNRDLLINPDGGLTPRGARIIELTPARRFQTPAELASTVVWLCSEGARMVDGVVIPIDGGFSAFSGV